MAEADPLERVLRMGKTQPVRRRSRRKDEYRDERDIYIYSVLITAKKTRCCRADNYGHGVVRLYFRSRGGLSFSRPNGVLTFTRVRKRSRLFALRIVRRNTIRAHGAADALPAVVV